VTVLPFYGSGRPDLFAVERRSMDRPGRVLARLEQVLPASGAVLDVGAGDGWTARRLASPTRFVVALEPADGMRAQATPHRAVAWVAGEAGALPLADGSVDAAYATWSYFFPSVTDPSRGLRELHRVVRDGGPIVVVSNAGDDGFTALGVHSGGEPLGWFAERGFEVEVIDTSFDLTGEDPQLARALLGLYVGAEERLPDPLPQRSSYRVAVCTARSRGPEPVRVRAMRASEADEVGRITLAAYDAYGRMRGPYRDYLADPRHRLVGSSGLLVAELDDRVVGTITYVVPGDREWEGRREPEGDAGFRVLAVDPTVEGRGVARALVRACLERAREEGRHRLVITSMAWMDRAHRLYEQLGFTPRPDLAVRFPNGDGVAFTFDLTDEAPHRFPPPGPVPDELPWYADVWAS
jgi:GNAT superfamily N-acetyltransferase/SAM-dependent methyltransferase